MALKGLRKGREEVMKTSGGGSKWTPYISWKDKDVKDLVFLTPAEDIAKVRLHNFVVIPTKYRDEKGEEKDGTRFGTFLCRKDPAMREESGNTCPLCDVIGHEAAEKNVAVALELDATREGKRVLSLDVATRKYTDKDDNERSVPRWGLVIQGPKNFFRPLIAQEQMSGVPLPETAFTVGRIGGDEKTTYAFVAINAPLPDLSDVVEQVPTLEDVLEEMGSLEKYERELADVKPGSQKSKYNSGATSDAASPGAGGEFNQSEFEKLATEVGAHKGEVENY